jgi:hypothetical protein
VGFIFRTYGTDGDSVPTSLDTLVFILIPTGLNVRHELFGSGPRSARCVNTARSIDCKKDTPVIIAKYLFRLIGFLFQRFRTMRSALSRENRIFTRIFVVTLSRAVSGMCLVRQNQRQ